MKNIIKIVFLLIALSTEGQTGKITKIPTILGKNGQTDTSFWFKSNQILANNLNLINLQIADGSFHLRLWTDRQCIELWKSEGKEYFARIINYAQHYNPKLLKTGRHEIDKTFYGIINLTPKETESFRELVTNTSIDNLPSQANISGWTEGFDGYEVLVEVSTKTTYDFKEYWTPIAFANTIAEAKKLQTFLETLGKELSLNERYERLKLPGGQYKRDGIPGIVITGPRELPPAIYLQDMF